MLAVLKAAIENSETYRLGEAIADHLGIILGAPVDMLGPSWPILGPPWPILGQSWLVQEPSWTILGPSWVPLKPCVRLSPPRPCPAHASFQVQKLAMLGEAVQHSENNRLGEAILNHLGAILGACSRLGTPLAHL